MQISPKDGSSLVANTGAQSDSQKSARDRAIARLTNIEPQVNQNQVAPEEVGSLSQAVVDSIPPTQQGQTNTSETPVSTEASSEQPPAEKKSEEPLSSQYAVLARKEKALRQQMQKFQAEQKLFRDQQAATQAPATPAVNPDADLRARLAKDPLGVLNEVGLTWDQLTQQALNQPSPEALAQQKAFNDLKAEIKALKDAQEGTKKNFEEQQTNAYKQAVQQLKSETKSLVSQDPMFETIKETNSIDDVVDLIERTFKEDGRLMTVEEAATAVEDYLVEQALKLARLKKIQQKLAPVAPPQTKQAPSQPQQQTMKTLTNANSTPGKLSARDRAILAFKGELKNQ